MSISDIFMYMSNNPSFAGLLHSVTHHHRPHYQHAIAYKSLWINSIHWLEYATTQSNQLINQIKPTNNIMAGIKFMILADAMAAMVVITQATIIITKVKFDDDSNWNKSKAP